MLRRKTQQRVTGVVVNQGLTVPREVRRRLRALLHRCKREGLDAVAAAQGQPDLAAVLAGTAGYVSMVQPALGAKLVAEVQAMRQSTWASRPKT